MITAGKGLDRKLLPAAFSIISEAITDSRSVLPSSLPIRIRLLVDSRTDGARTMGGAFGITLTRTRMDLYLDSSAMDWEKSLRRAVVHEYNHLLRAQRVRKPFTRYTLRDVMATEGLAQCFELEIMGSPGRYSTAVSKREAMKAFRLLEPHLDEINGSLHTRAFFAMDDREFEHWSGNTASFILVRKTLETLGLSWNDVMNLESRRIIGH